MVQTLGKKDSRTMNTLSFFEFKQRLKFKCEERGVKLLIVNEAYTSKTCTRCGNVKTFMKRTRENRDYQCNECGLLLDSDLVGARNIYLKTYSGC